MYGYHTKRCTQGIFPVKIVDTTAAGDTFTGYFFGEIINGKTPEEALKTAMQVNSTRYHNDLERMVKLLDAYSPLKVLSRGYSVTYKNDKVITDVDDLNINDELTIRLSKGMVLTKVEDIKHGK